MNRQRFMASRCATHLMALLCLSAGFGCASDKTPAGTRNPTAAGSGSASSAMTTTTTTTTTTTSSGTSPAAGSSAASSTNTGAPAASSAGAAASTTTTTLMRPPPTAAGCEPNALDQVGCACDKPGATRPCYSADPKTRNIGMCKDGIQTCVGDNAAGVEFAAGQWGPCKEQVEPTECKEQLDARCVGKVGCADEGCAMKLNCAKDAGMPDAGKGRCFTVMGFGIGTGFFPDGGMWCER